MSRQESFMIYTNIMMRFCCIIINIYHLFITLVPDTSVARNLLVLANRSSYSWWEIPSRLRIRLYMYIYFYIGKQVASYFITWLFVTFLSHVNIRTKEKFILSIIINIFVGHWKRPLLIVTIINQWMSAKRKLLLNNNWIFVFNLTLSAIFIWSVVPFFYHYYQHNKTKNIWDYICVCLCIYEYCTSQMSTLIVVDNNIIIKRVNE